MPDPTTTIRDWPPQDDPAAPLLVRHEALAESRRHEGRRERKKNLGTIVIYSIDGFHGKEGDAWCAFFLAQNVRQALLARVARGEPGAELLLARWMRLVSGTCATLWERLSEEGWGWRLGDTLPPALGGVVGVPGLPEVADIAFYGEKPHHVGWVAESAARVEGGKVVGPVRVFSGNSGPNADRVILSPARDLAEGQPCRFVRLPW